MTTLSKQLDTLRTSTSRQLTVERSHVSLLFDRQEAEKLDRETILKIGSSGFAQLKKLDSSFEDCSEFFEESVINFQRTLITKEENEELDKKLKRFIFKLSPYLLHFSCQQVLEWLINRYKIHAYNPEFLILSFIPFHDTNLYGRLLSILEYDFSVSKEWLFLQEFRSQKLPVPFHRILKHALSSNHGLIKCISDHIDQGVEIMGADFMDRRASLFYTFYAKLAISVLEANKVPDEDLISRIIPVVTEGLRTPVNSFRNASLMIICQICHAVTLAPKVVRELVRILLLTMKEANLNSILSTLIVVCQTQNVEEFSKKAFLKFLRRSESLQTWSAINKLSSQTDLLPFFVPLWSSLFSTLSTDATDSEKHQIAISALQKSSQAEMLSGKQAYTFLSQTLSAISNNSIDFPESVKADIYNLCLRHSNEYNAFVEEWKSKDNDCIEKFVDEFNLNALSLARPEAKKSKKKRHTPVERAHAMAATSGFAKRQKFRGDPIKKALEWISNDDIENVLWALDEMTTRKGYFSNQVEEDIEDLAVKLIEFARKDNLIANKMKSAFSLVSFRPQFICALLSRYELNGSTAKKSKGVDKAAIETIFEDETDDMYWKRVSLVLEILNISQKLLVDAKLFNVLFDFLKNANSIQNAELCHRLQHLSTTVLIKMASTSGGYKPTAKDIKMDTIVELMRSTQSHHILREALKLLTAVVQLNPGSITSHIMSVFTFMGSGLLRRDNELTLGIIERTLETLFSAAIVNGSKNQSDVITKLIAISKVFSASAPDIPAHRRGRMAQAISRAVSVEYIWIIICVLIENFCTKWQRNDQSKKMSDQDAFEDIAQELCASLSATDQLSVILDVMNYVVRLGGDSTLSKLNSIDAAVFDRTKFTIQKLRHFRFVLVGIAVKVLSSKIMLEELSTCRDERLYNVMVPIGKKLLTASVDLDDFVVHESEKAEKSEDAQTLRYWIALQARSDAVSDKLRYLLPGGVAANLIADVLEDDKTDCKLREKVLQLANIKLLTEGYFYTDSGINETHLTRLASVLSNWIIPIRGDKDKVELCKNATFTLKLIAKRIPKQSESIILTETMNKAVAVIKNWQTLDDSMIGNVLFLAGELIRSHNMRCTMMSCEPLLSVCLAIINEYLSTSYQNKEEEEVSQTRRQRVRQQSLSGKKLGSDTLLISALTCMQRILDQFSAFVSNHMSDILLNYCRLSSKFPFVDLKSGCPSGPIHHRLNLIRLAISNMELRTLSMHFVNSVKILVADQKSMCSLMTLLGAYFNHKKRQDIVPLRMTLLTEVFLPALEVRINDRKPENFEIVSEIEKCIFGTFLKMADILTDTELRPILSTIVQWGDSALSLSEPNLSIRIRLVTLYNFANEFYNYFKQLAMPHFGKLIEMAPKVLAGCNATEISDPSQLLLNGKRNTVEGLETDLLIRQIIIFIENCGRHKEFLSTHTIESLASALIAELVNTRVSGHESRCVPHLANALYRICDASPESFSDIMNKIMLKTRNNRPKIRFRALLVLEALIEKIGDAIAPQLPLIMPFLSELLEDETKKVEEQCDRVIRLLQKKFGESIAEGFT